MRVLLIVARTEIGGVSTHIDGLVAGLAHRVEFGLVCGEDGYLADLLRSRGHFVAVVGALVREPNPLKDLRALLDLRRVIRRWSPDLVHAHSFKAGLVGRVAAWLEGVPSLYTPHAFPFMPGAPIHWRLISAPLERLLARISKAVICVSKYELELAIRHLHLPRGHEGILIYNGLPDTKERASPGPTNGEVRIVSVGRFAEPKMQEDIIRALADIKTGYELVLVGDGPARSASERLAIELGVGEKVDFTGVRDDVPQILARAHIFVLASKWESLPYGVLEAMRAGLPIVASDVGGMAEAVSEGTNGYLVPVGDVDVLRERLLALIENPDRRQGMGSAGRKDFEGRFAIRSQLDRTLDLYGSIAAG